jgi:hypothetical protein
MSNQVADGSDIVKAMIAKINKARDAHTNVPTTDTTIVPVPKSTPTILAPTPKERMRKCIKCGERKLLTEFGKHSKDSNELQSYCKACKNGLHKKRMEDNLTARVRHHFATRIASTLGRYAPKKLVQDLETYLGYPMRKLIMALDEELKLREGISLRSAMIRGYHIDHIRPLSSFKVVLDNDVDWDEFQRCWAIENLRAISAQENLAKGAKRTEQ